MTVQGIWIPDVKIESVGRYRGRPFVPGTLQVLSFPDHLAYSAAVEGYYQIVTLDFGTHTGCLWVNEMYAVNGWGLERANPVASRLAEAGGRIDMASYPGVFGPAVLTGPIVDGGHDSNFTDAGMAVVLEVMADAKK